MVSLVSWSLPGVGIPARFHRSVFHSSILARGLAGRPELTRVYSPVVTTSSVEQEDSWSAFNQPSSVYQLDASFPHGLEGEGERCSWFTTIWVSRKASFSTLGRLTALPTRPPSGRSCTRVDRSDMLCTPVSGNERYTDAMGTHRSPYSLTVTGTLVLMTV